MPDARAAWVVGPRQVELRDERIADPGPGEVLVRSRFGAVSRGTERLVIEGRVPPELATQMRAPFQAGEFPWPVKYGYCNVGVVEAGDLPAGTRVFCLYPHQDRYVVPVSAVVPVPEAVPSERAVLAANVETAVNAVWDGGAAPGDRVVVVGGGVVGSLIAWVCAGLPGAEVTLVDVIDRSSVARALGAAFAPPDAAPGDADVVFHASASAEGLGTALRLAGREATVVEASWFGDRSPATPLGGPFFARRLRLVASQVGAVPTARAPRWSLRRRLELALRLLASPAVDALVDGESAFSDLPTALPAVTEGAGGGLCHRVRY